MIPAHNVYERDDEVYVDEKSFISKIKEAFKTRNLNIITAPPGKRLVGTLAAGLTPDDIELLKKLRDEGKISDKFRVKREFPLHHPSSSDS